MEKALGPDNPALAGVLVALAGLYQAKEDYARAEPLYQRALSINEKALGPDHPDVARSLDALAGLYLTKGDYVRAEPLLERSLRLHEKELGPDSPMLAFYLDGLAGLYLGKGDYARAEPLYLRALGIREKAQASDPSAVVTSLFTLAMLYQTKGDYARAEPLLARALEVQEKALGPDHPAVADSLDHVALVAQLNGDYVRAERLFQRALGIREKALGPDHARVATSLTNLAGLYQIKGDYERAEPLLERALGIQEKALGPDHASVAGSLVHQGTLYQAKGDYERAERLFQRALSSQEKAWGPDSVFVTLPLRYLALLYQEKGDYSRAEPLFQRALRTAENERGMSAHPYVALSLSDLARLHQASGDFTRAQPLLLRALDLQEKGQGPDAPALAVYLDQLAWLHVAQGRLADAVQAEKRGAAIEERNAAHHLVIGSELERRAYMATLTDSTARTISLHMQAAPSDVRAARLALTTILQRKGRVLDVMADSLAAVRRHLTPSDQGLFDQLSSVKSQLGVQLWRGPGKLPLEQYRKNLHDLEERRQKLEEQLGQRSAAFRAEQQPVSVEEVQKAIPKGAALLEIFRYKPYSPKPHRPADRWGAPRYVAYVARGQGDPSFADLGEAAPIEAAVQKLRAVLADLHRAGDPKPAARALDALVMQPIRELLGTTSWVLLSPDADLNLVPFEALIDEQGRYLIERFAFTYLTSGRDLIRLEEHAAPKQGALLVANPDYGVFGASPPGQRQEAGHRGLRSVDLTGARFTPLTETAEEARIIAHGFSDAHVLLGAQATEGAVKAAQGPRILHLATHGFFLPDQPDARPPTERRPDPDLEPTPQEAAALLQRENPLLRAGLALAFANTRVSGDKDDGILTALEVSSMDLHGTKLVVLSACETGIGEAVSGEGVYGLRRALVMAGAETQVMSLWKVDTVWTRELMIAYYQKLKAGAGRSEALRQAQLEMLGTKETSHPNVWASFIASGDWRTLDEAPATPDFTVHPGPRGCACAQAGAGSAESRLGGVLAVVALWAAVGRRRRTAPDRNSYAITQKTAWPVCPSALAARRLRISQRGTVVAPGVVAATRR